MADQNNNKEVLEERVEEVEKNEIVREENPSLKQWIPFGVGVYFAINDAVQGKPHIMDPKKPVKLYASAIYHGVVSAYPIYLGVMDLIQR